MILVTAGNSHYEFSRAMQAMDRIAVEESLDVLFQVGHSSYLPVNGRTVKFLSAEEFDDTVTHSTLVVCGGGVGTILTCLRLGVPVVVFPREKAWGEVIDDHGSEFSQQLEDRGLLQIVRSEADLHLAVTSGRAKVQELDFSSSPLTRAVRVAVEDLIATRRSRRTNAVSVPQHGRRSRR